MQAQAAAVLLVPQQTCRMPQDSELVQVQAGNGEDLASIFPSAAVYSLHCDRQVSRQGHRGASGNPDGGSSVL